MPSLSLLPLPNPLFLCRTPIDPHISNVQVAFTCSKAFDWHAAREGLSSTTAGDGVTPTSDGGWNIPPLAHDVSRVGSYESRSSIDSYEARAMLDEAADLSDVFDAKLAAFAYRNFCLLLGQESMRKHLYNSSSVEQLMYDLEDGAASNDPCPELGIENFKAFYEGSGPPQNDELTTNLRSLKTKFDAGLIDRNQ